MGKIFYIMGKSSSGKDTIFQEILNQKDLGLNQIMIYTTRPRRAKEIDGVEYHFVNEETLYRLEADGKVIEKRAYDTVHGVWYYFTVDDAGIDLRNKDYLAIGTLVSYEKMRDYYGVDHLIPIYIEVSDDNRLERALKRERKQREPKYGELCRRFLADSQDFSEMNLEKAGIGKRFYNNVNREICMQEVADYILSQKSH